MRVRVMYSFGNLSSISGNSNMLITQKCDSFPFCGNKQPIFSTKCAIGLYWKCFKSWEKTDQKKKYTEYRYNIPFCSAIAHSHMGAPLHKSFELLYEIQCMYNRYYLNKRLSNCGILKGYFWYLFKANNINLLKITTSVHQ